LYLGFAASIHILAGQWPVNSHKQFDPALTVLEEDILSSLLQSSVLETAFQDYHGTVKTPKIRL